MTSDDDFIGTLEDYLDSFDGATRCPIASATRSMPSCQGPARFVPSRVR
jgi:hypothetical protein